MPFSSAPLQHSNFNSFVRQLNMYSFEKTKRVPVIVPLVPAGVHGGVGSGGAGGGHGGAFNGYHGHHAALLVDEYGEPYPDESDPAVMAAMVKECKEFWHPLFRRSRPDLLRECCCPVCPAVPPSAPAAAAAAPRTAAHPPLSPPCRRYQAQDQHQAARG